MSRRNQNQAVAEIIYKDEVIARYFGFASLIKAIKKSLSLGVKTKIRIQNRGFCYE